MKKTFLLQVEGKNPDRILEAVKHEVRKYARREGRKTVPQWLRWPPLRKWCP